MLSAKIHHAIAKFANSLVAKYIIPTIGLDIYSERRVEVDLLEESNYKE
jgi:hypothetical protein